jgi:hypothetical protein
MEKASVLSAQKSKKTLLIYCSKVFNFYSKIGYYSTLVAEREGLISLIPFGGAKITSIACSLPLTWSFYFKSYAQTPFGNALKQKCPATPGNVIDLRRGRDSNTRYPFEVYTLSRRALSTTQTPLRIWDCKSIINFDNPLAGTKR